LIRHLVVQFGMRAKATAHQLKLAYATVTRVLRRLKLTASTKPTPKSNRYEHERPGDMIHRDIKKLARFNRPGHRVGAKYKANKNLDYEYVHVCGDDHSCWAYVEVLPNEQKDATLGFIKRSLEALQRIGVQVRRLMSDNGPAYRSRMVNAFLQARRIRHVFTKPYTPRTNGMAERFIRTLLNEWAYARPYPCSISRQRALPAFLNHYSLQRPHTALEHKPPAARINQICEHLV